MKKEFFVLFFCMMAMYSCKLFGPETSDEVVEMNPKEVEVEVVEEKREKPEEMIQQEKEVRREWSILIYMCADNNLESAAIEDICEMETSCLDTDKIGVYILLDRSSSYDTSNGNWDDTRFLKLKTGKNEESNYIVSEEIECRELGLLSSVNVELDMSSPYVLKDALSFVQNYYEADHYGLIMWGHGTGWRNENNVNNQLSGMEERIGGYKGFAFDETTHSYMTLKQLSQALAPNENRKKLEFLGFDTCFGAELEVVYELKDCTDFSVGSEGLLMNSGWNYKEFFSELQNLQNITAEDICRTLVNGFKNWYSTASNASMTITNHGAVQNYFDCFNDYTRSIAELITTRQIRDKVMGLLYSDLNCEVEKYTYGSINDDIYLDIHSMVEVLNNYFEDSTYLQKYSENLKKAEEKVITASWNSFGTNGGLGVYFNTLDSGGFLSVSHPVSYIRGKTGNQINFVMDCQGYVPNLKNEKSLLERLFYEEF